MAIDMKAIHDSQSTLVMGVLNITEDSFSDGGLWLAPEAAKAHGEAMMKAGADIIDIGAESTRPGAKRVSEADEKARVLGAVDALIPEGAVLSIDTTRASVALADHSDCLYIVQHWRGWLAGAAGNVPDADTSRYEHGVVNDVHDELMRQVDAVLEAGVQAEQVIIDPGLGFSKPGVEHNLPILAALDRFNAAGYPVLIGASRKRFVGSLLAGAGVTEPDMASKDTPPRPSAPCVRNMACGPCACMTWRKAATRSPSATHGASMRTRDRANRR